MKGGLEMSVKIWPKTEFGKELLARASFDYIDSVHHSPPWWWVENYMYAPDHMNMDRCLLSYLVEKVQEAGEDFWKHFKVEGYVRRCSDNFCERMMSAEKYLRELLGVRA